MAQAFLMRMDHFDRLLELDLAHWLDPIVDAPAPRRRRPRGAGTLKAKAGGLIVAPSDMVLLAEPVTLAIVVPIGIPAS
jgi:hypothetical protein